MCGNRHDGTCTVAHQYIIRYKNRDFFIVNRVYRSHTIQTYTCLVFCKLSSLEVGFLSSLSTISYHFIPVFDLILVFIKNRMFRGYYHIGNTKQCITSGCIDTKLIFFAFDTEIYFRTGGFTDPVFLGYSNLFHIIYMVKTFNQFFSIVGDF